MSGGDFQVVQPFNAKKHEEEIYGGVSLPTMETNIPAEDAGKGYIKKVTKSYLPSYEEEAKLGGPKNIDKIDANTDYNYKNNEAARDMYEQVLANTGLTASAKAEYKRVRGVDPKNDMQVIQGYNYMNVPNQKYVEGSPFQPEPSYVQKRADSMEDKMKMNRITSAQADARSNKNILAANANANVDYVRGQMNSWELPNQHIELNGKNYRIIEPPKAIKDKYANDEADIDPLTTKKVTYKSNPMIVKDPETGEIYSVPQNVDRTTHSVKDTYNPKKMTNITGDFHSKATNVLVPSEAKGKINEGLSNTAPKGETWAEKQKRLRQK